MLATALPLWADATPVVWDPRAVRQTGSLTDLFPVPSKIYDFTVSDFDGDGNNEVGAIRGSMDYPYGIYIREILSGNYTFRPQQINIQDKSTQLFYLAHHSLYRYLTYRLAGERAYFDLYNYRLQRLDSLGTEFGVDRTGKGFWQGGLREIQMVDLNLDGQEDLLASFNTAGDGQPRALLGYDLQSKRKLLDIRLAPMLMSTHVLDLQMDGNPEILVSLGGASDGPFFGPFSRDSSYIAEFDVKGNVIHKKAFGGVSSYVAFDVEDVDGDNVKDIIATSLSMINQNAKNSRLVILDGKTFAEKASLEGPLPSYFSNVILCDTDQDHRAEIYVCESLNRLCRYVYRADVQKLVLEKTAMVGDEPQVQQFADLDGDEIPELLVYTVNPKRLWFATNKLIPLAYVSFAGQGDRFKLTGSGCPSHQELRYLVLHEFNLSLVKIPFSDIFPVADIQLHWRDTTFQMSWRRGLVYVVIITGVILGAVVLILFLSGSWRSWPVADSERVAMAYFNANHRLVHCNSRFVHLLGRPGAEIKKALFTDLFAADNWKALSNAFNNFSQQKATHLKQEISVGSIMEPKSVELEIMRGPRNWTVLLITDLLVSTQLERIRWWAAMAQRMAHKIKTPLATVLLAIQRMQRTYRKSAPDLVSSLDPITTSAMAEIERVREIINTFMKFAKLDEPSFVVSDFTRVVQDGLNEYFKRIPEGVEVKTSFEVEEMPVSIDIKQFEEALNNILDNAVSAVKGEGVVMLSTHFEKHPLNAWGSSNHAVLEVSDSGPGMDKAQLSHIFEPGYTTRSDGSGMGLVFARSIIESHLGELTVSSHSGMGTTVEIRLPLFAKTGESSEQNSTRVDR